jgi:hypothetical protein
MRKYADQSSAAAVPSPGAARPASSPAAAEPRRIAERDRQRPGDIQPLGGIGDQAGLREVQVTA